MLQRLTIHQWLKLLLLLTFPLILATARVIVLQVVAVAEAETVVVAAVVVAEDQAAEVVAVAAVEATKTKIR